MARRGRPKKIQPEHLPVLRDIATDMPPPTLSEIRDEFAARTGVLLHVGTLSKALQEAGITRLRGGPDDADPPASEPEPSPPGYPERHRKRASKQRYPSCLTDAEWTLVADIFDGEGHQGTPPRYSRRLLVDACCYVIRNGNSWRMLPAAFPPWQNVYRTFRRWSEQGKFEAMHDRLRAQWRGGHGPILSTAVLDAQSTHHSPQGGTSDHAPPTKAVDCLNLEHFTPHRLVVLADWVSRSLATTYQKRFSISIPEWRILAQLSRFQSQSAGHLSELTNMDKPRTSRALRRMEERGLIARERHSRDQRVAVIRLTPSGVAIYAEIAPLALEWEQQLVTEFSDEERGALDGLLERLRVRLQAMRTEETN